MPGIVCANWEQVRIDDSVKRLSTVDGLELLIKFNNDQQFWKKKKHWDG